jgi:hypothetical protein
MTHRTLREAAKFFAGVVAAEALTLLWLWSNNLFPVSMWGATWTADVVMPSVVFDIAVILILVHYGWNLGRIPRPKERNYLMVAGCIFTLVAFAHLLRIFTGTDLVLLGWAAPLWLSWLGVIVATYLAYASFHFSMLRGK